MEELGDVAEDMTTEKIGQLLTLMQDSLKAYQSVWLSEAKELNLQPEDMTALYELNFKNRSDPPDDATEEEKKAWDYWNGLDAITWEDLEPIFGKSHKCYGVDISQTRDRLKGACKDHQAYIQIMHEYQTVHDGYIHLVEEEEENEIQSLVEMIASLPEGDERIPAMQASIDQYYYLKYLGWLAEPVPEDTIQRVVGCMHNEEKISYYMRRTKMKLKQLDISPKFMAEISKFEERFLDEEFKTNSQVLLAFFCHFVTFADISKPVKGSDSPGKLDRTKIVCFVHGIDQMIRKRCTATMGEKIMNNVIALEQQFLGKTPRPKE